MLSGQIGSKDRLHGLSRALFLNAQRNLPALESAA